MGVVFTKSLFNFHALLSKNPHGSAPIDFYHRKKYTVFKKSLKTGGQPMKILSILGSPNREGNTAKLLEYYLEGVCNKNHDAENETVFLREKNIAPCMGCNACKGKEANGCIVKDDMQPYYKRLEETDVLIIATPVYWFNMTAQTKTFVDRMYGLNFKAFPAGKKLVLLTTYGDHDMFASGAINLANSLRKTGEFLGFDYAFEYGANSSIPIEENHVI